MDYPLKRPGPPKGLKIRPLTEKELTEPTLKVKVAPSTDADKALAKLVAERAAYAKKNKGNYPSDEQLMKSRKNK
jgi:hypothetical protein